MDLGLSRPTAWFDLDTEVDTFSNLIDMGPQGLEGVLVFGSENLESRGACGRLSLRPCHRITSNGLCGIFQKCNTTNHRCRADAAAHPVHRRLTSPVKATIQSTSRRVGIRARDIGGIVQDHFPDSVYAPRDIYNARALINRENLGCYSSTAALIRLFDEKGIPTLRSGDRDEPDRLVGLVLTFPYCLRMWKRFSEVISFDNTYNTNRFKLPLFQVTGHTCLGTVFNAAFGLIDNERLEGFQFLANGVRTLLSRTDMRTPDVVITDFDKQMKQALVIEFPEAQQQICIHHINSNVMLRSKRRWVYGTRDRVAGEEDVSDEPDADLDDRDWQAVQESER